MKIIEQVISQTEKKLKEKIKTTQEKIDFNPFAEAVIIREEIFSLVNGDMNHDYLERLKILKNRSSKNERDIKRVMKPHYSENLYEVMRDLETQKIDLYRFKMYINFAND
jgi:hypothetical protein